jgi:peptidoglycan/LPS O-acetylase OafA/YrhL
MQAFFVVSGFLITYTAMRRFSSLKLVRPLVFYRIRFARIAPLLVVLLLVLSILHLARVPYYRIDPAVATLPRALFAVLTFHVNLLQAAHGWLPWNWSILWSLSVEETFYFVFPLVCSVLPRGKRGTIMLLVVLLALVAIGPVARLPPFSQNPISLLESYFGNMDNVAIGCMIAIFVDLSCRKRWFSALLWPIAFQYLGLGLIVLVELAEWPGGRLLTHLGSALDSRATASTLFAVGVALVLLGGVLRSATGGSLTSPIRWLGRLSYEVYLTHFFVIIGLWSILPANHPGYFSIWLCLTVLLSSLLGFLVSTYLSEPANRLLRGAPLPFQLKPITKAPAGSSPLP